MKIESCPICGKEVRFDLGDLSAKCVSCFYTGPTDDNEAAAHNRLSRIVRAAEKLAVALQDEKVHDYDDRYTAVVNEAEDELCKAVSGEGGAE